MNIFFSSILVNNNSSLKIYCENIVIAFLNFSFLFFILFFRFFFLFHSHVSFLFLFSSFFLLHSFPSTPFPYLGVYTVRFDWFFRNFLHHASRVRFHPMLDRTSLLECKNWSTQDVVNLSGSMRFIRLCGLGFYKLLF